MFYTIHPLLAHVSTRNCLLSSVIGDLHSDTFALKFPATISSSLPCPVTCSNISRFYIFHFNSSNFLLLNDLSDFLDLRFWLSVLGLSTRFPMLPFCLFFPVSFLGYLPGVCPFGHGLFLTEGIALSCPSVSQQYHLIVLSGHLHLLESWSSKTHQLQLVGMLFSVFTNPIGIRIQPFLYCLAILYKISYLVLLINLRYL